MMNLSASVASVLCKDVTHTAVAASDLSNRNRSPDIIDVVTDSGMASDGIGSAIARSMVILFESHKCSNND